MSTGDIDKNTGSENAFMNAREVASLLRRSEKWVYDHAGELGAAKIGGSIFFTEWGLEDAIQRGQEVARSRHIRREKAPGTASNKACGWRVGKPETEGTKEGREDAARRHGLDDLLR